MQDFIITCSRCLFISLLGLILSITDGSAQGSAYHVKGGFSIAQQNYNGYSRQARNTWHATASIENLTIEDKYALFAQIGYHQRGSTIRIPSFINTSGMLVNRGDLIWKFGNLGLILGGKQKFGGYTGPRWFYGIGLRGEYNLNTEIDDFFEGLEDQTNNLLFGVTASIGAEWMLSDLVGGVIELQVHPDLSDQLVVPAQQSVDGSGIIPERRVRNLTIELSIGVRLLRIVDYVD